MDLNQYIKDNIRTVSNWPAPGVQFRDITPVLQNPKSFRVVIDLFVHRYMDMQPDVIAGLDARGFILGSVLAYELSLGLSMAMPRWRCIPMPLSLGSAWCWWTI
jgi:adenine phosphoribosyltransferase